ncbi:hypothetical protein Trydic_g4715 [Trypoxylus dichotomus]
MNCMLPYILFFSLLNTAVEPLRCWKCRSSSAINCGDPFLKAVKFERSSIAKFNTQEPAIHTCKPQFVPYNYPPERIKPMCMKRVETIGDDTYYARLCTFMPINELPAKKCPGYELENPYANIEYCEICSTDLCNTSSSLEYTLCMMIVMIISALLMQK